MFEFDQGGCSARTRTQFHNCAANHQTSQNEKCQGSYSPCKANLDEESTEHDWVDNPGCSSLVAF